MSDSKKSNKVVISIMMVLIAFGLAWSIFNFIMYSEDSTPQIRITDIVMYLLVAYYGLWGYKKPHGNILKYLMLLFGVSLIPSILVSVSGSYVSQILQIIMSIAVLLVGYISGRLYKFQTNRILIIIVTAIFIFRLFTMPMLFPTVTNPILLLGPLNQVILWLAICVAYFSRYQLHKEAGLQDKPA